jgi:hypothetical protein
MAKIITVPKTPASAYDPSRRVSSLLKAHVDNLEAIVQRRTGITRARKPRTERQAAEYIAELTRQLHPPVDPYAAAAPPPPPMAPAAALPAAAAAEPPSRKRRARRAAATRTRGGTRVTRSTAGAKAHTVSQASAGTKSHATRKSPKRARSGKKR